MLLEKRIRSDDGETTYACMRAAPDAPPSPSTLGGSVDAIDQLAVFANRVEMRLAWCHSSGHAEMYVDGPLDVIARGPDGWPRDLLPAIAKRFGDAVAAEVDLLLKDPNAFRSVAEAAAPKKVEDVAASLDIDEHDLPLLEAVVEHLTDKRDWAQLERAYRKFLRIVGTNPSGDPAKRDLEASLWERLARVHALRLGNTESAITAYEMRLKCEPPPGAAVLYGLGLCYEDVERWDAAVTAHEAATRSDPVGLDAYRRLFEIHPTREDADGKYLAAAVLTLLRAPDEEPAEVVFTHAPTRLSEVDPLDDAGWKQLRFPGEDPLISAIMRFVLPSEEPKMPPVDTESLMWAAHVLGAPQEDNGAILRPGADLDQLRGDRLLVEHLFIAGREATVFHSPHYGYARSPGPELAVAFYAGLKAVRASASVPAPYAPAVALLATSLQRTLAPAVLEKLGAVVDLFVQSGGRADLTAWQRAIRMTRLRAGLLVGGGVTGLRTILATDDDELTASQKLTHALPFAVGAEHRALRVKTRMALGMRKWAPIQAPPAPKAPEGVVIGGPDRRARTLAEMQFAASLRGCAKCGAAPKDLAVAADGDRRVLRGACRFCGTPAVFTFFAVGDPEKTSAPPRELGDAQPSQVVTAAELTAELDRLKESGLDESTTERALVCILELLKHPDPAPSLLADRDRLLAKPEPPAPPVSLDAIVAALLVPAEQLRTVGALEAALGLRLDLEGERLKACAMGQLATELQGLVTNVVVRYAWDVHHQSPVASLDELRTQSLVDWSVTFASGAPEIQRALWQRFGPPRVLPTHHLYGGVWLLATRGPAFILSRFAVLPDWAVPPVDPAQRERALLHLAQAVYAASDGAALLRAAGTVIAGTGIVPRSSGAAHVDFDLVPPIPATDLARVLGWSHPVGQTFTVHQTSWTIRLVTGHNAFGPTTTLPMIGRWPIEARLDARPTGGPMEGPPGPPGGTHRLAPKDLVRHLRIGSSGSA